MALRIHPNFKIKLGHLRRQLHESGHLVTTSRHGVQSCCSVVVNGRQGSNFCFSFRTNVIHRTVCIWKYVFRKFSRETGKKIAALMMVDAFKLFELGAGRQITRRQRRQRWQRNNTGIKLHCSFFCPPPGAHKQPKQGKHKGKLLWTFCVLSRVPHENGEHRL